MQGIDSLDTKDPAQKCEYFAKLTQSIPQFNRVSDIVLGVGNI